MKKHLVNFLVVLSLFGLASPSIADPLPAAPPVQAQFKAIALTAEEVAQLVSYVERLPYGEAAPIIGFIMSKQQAAVPPTSTPDKTKP